MGGVFGRRRQQHVRADVSLISSWLTALMTARSGTGMPVPYDELPITVGTCQLIADALAAMPLHPVDLDGRRTSDTFAVLEQPNPEEDRGETIHKIAQAMYWTGNGPVLNGPRDSSGAVEAITVLNPLSVDHMADPLDELRVKTWLINGQDVGRLAVTNFKLNDDPRRGPMGRSPLVQCATALDTYGWAYRSIGDHFAQGGPPNMVIKSKTELDPAKIVELSEEWISARRQTRPAFLPQWLDLEIPNTSGELAQTIEVLSMAAAEVARLLNLPVALVNAPVAGYSLQYSNVGDEFRRWLAVSLGTTWVARIERGFSQLLPPNRRARMDPSQLYRPDLFPEGQPPATLATQAAPPELTPA